MKPLVQRSGHATYKKNTIRDTPKDAMGRQERQGLASLKKIGKVSLRVRSFFAKCKGKGHGSQRDGCVLYL